jgi:hypothetical protein
MVRYNLGLHDSDVKEVRSLSSEISLQLPQQSAHLIFIKPPHVVANMTLEQ